MRHLPGWMVTMGKKPLARHTVGVHNAGALIKNGSIVIFDAASMATVPLGTSAAPGEDWYVTTTTTVANQLTRGVAVGDIPAAGKGSVCIFGPAQVALKANSTNVAIGDQIVTGATAGYGYKSTGSVAAGRCLGFALAASTADASLTAQTGLTPVFVDASNELLSGLTATTGQLNALPVNGTVTSHAGASNVSTITVQLKDTNGTNLTYATAVDVYLSDAAAGGALTGTAPSSGFTAATTGGIISNLATSKEAIRCLTSATGQLVLSLTDTGKHAYYVVVVTAAGVSIIGSVAVTTGYGA